MPSARSSSPSAVPSNWVKKPTVRSNRVAELAGHLALERLEVELAQRADRGDRVCAAPLGVLQQPVAEPKCRIGERTDEWPATVAGAAAAACPQRPVDGLGADRLEEPLHRRRRTPVVECRIRAHEQAAVVAGDPQSPERPDRGFGDPVEPDVVHQHVQRVPGSGATLVSQPGRAQRPADASGHRPAAGERALGLQQRTVAAGARSNEVDRVRAGPRALGQREVAGGQGGRLGGVDGREPRGAATVPVLELVQPGAERPEHGTQRLLVRTASPLRGASWIIGVTHASSPGVVSRAASTLRSCAGWRTESGRSGSLPRRIRRSPTGAYRSSWKGRVRR